MRKHLGGAINAICLLAAVVLVGWGITEALKGRVGVGIFLAFLAFVVFWGVGGTVLQAWNVYEPGRHYLLGAVIVFGVMGGLSLEQAITADGPIGAVVSGIAAAILIPFAFVALYGWMKLATRKRAGGGS